MEKDLIKITEMATLHGISRQTLIHYDKIGLLEPAYVSESGYRYYSVYQIPRLREICFLKETGVPLSEIRSYMEHRSVEGMQTLLSTRKEEIDQQMAELARQRSYLQQRKEIFSHIDTKRRNIDQPIFEWLPERKAIFSPYPDEEMDKSQLHLSLMGAWGRLASHGMIPSSGFGSIIRTSSLQQNRPLKDAGSIIILPFSEEFEDDELITLPAGEYITMYKYSMPYDIKPATKLLDWIAENGYEPMGDVIDLCLLDTNFHDDEHQEDFCRLEVRVK